MIKDYFILSIRNLNRRGIRSWLTLLGIFIGVMVVISLISLGDGLKTAVNSQFGVSTTQAITVQAAGVSGYGAPGTGVIKPITFSDAEAIAKINGVEFALARIIQTIKVQYNNKLSISFAASLPEQKLKEVYEIQDIKVESGRLLEKNDVGKIIVGNNLKYKDKNGFEKDIAVADSLKINNKTFKVVGIMKKKGSFILDNVILMMEKDLKILAGNNDDASVIVAKVKEKNLVDKVKTDIEDLLRERRNVKKGEEDFSVQTAEAALATVNSILNGVQIFIVLIASISILIGSLGIVNTMTTSVLERKKEIGIMKAIGARNSQIFTQFLIEAGILGLIGGLIGVLAGVILGYIGIIGINNFIGATTKPQINLILIFTTLIGSFLIGAISGILPAIKAAKQNPVQAIRD